MKMLSSLTLLALLTGCQHQATGTQAADDGSALAEACGKPLSDNAYTVKAGVKSRRVIAYHDTELILSFDVDVSPYYLLYTAARPSTGQLLSSEQLREVMPCTRLLHFRMFDRTSR